MTPEREPYDRQLHVDDITEMITKLEIFAQHFADEVAENPGNIAVAGKALIVWMHVAIAVAAMRATRWMVANRVLFPFREEK